MIPKTPGQYTVPAVSFAYFDPATKAYKTVSSKPQKINVSGSADRVDSPTAAAPTSQITRAGQDRLNRRLRSILSRASLRPVSARHPVTRPWFLVLVLGVPLIYLGFIMASQTRRRLRETRVRNRSRYADSESLKQLAALGKQHTKLSSEQFFKELEACLIGFIENRLEEKALGDTMSELKERLTDRGVDTELSDQVVAELEACDFARFARSAEGAKERRQALDRIEKLIKALARVKLAPKKKERR
jgi:hypothetical protein